MRPMIALSAMVLAAAFAGRALPETTSAADALKGRPLTETELATFEQTLAHSLLDIGLKPGDCKIRYDYATPDKFRLPLVDSLMNDPTSLLRRVNGIATRVETESTLTGAMTEIWQAMSVEGRLESGLGRPATDREVRAGCRIRDVRGKLAHLPRELGEPVATYVRHLDGLGRLRDKAVENVRPYLDFLRTNAPFMVTPRPDYGDVSPFQLDSLETADTALGDSLLHVSEKVDVPAIASMSLAAIGAAEHLLAEIERFAASDSSAHGRRSLPHYNGSRITFGGQTSVVTGSILYLGLTDWGPVVVGDSSSNTYEGSFALIIDLGGDDTYNLASNPKTSFSLVIDKAGNDTYRSAGGAGIAGALFGTSIVMDLAGNDTYQAGDISLGAGIYGAGVLYDRAGDDTYNSGAFSQGAGFLGVGLLCDAAGNDTYTAAMESQAFGYVMGAGVILERGGNDTYLTKMSQTDILRYEDHYLTFSQGCAFGYRPDYSGGIGLLIDEAGNDLYSSDIFGQGMGYWFCVGALIDRGGHDCYRSYQYAQGAGIHLAFGLLLDEWGDDYYVSKGVSQGCGHDLSLGLLADFSGNDCYTAVDLSQGAGSANGTGILYDAEGVDSYSSKSKVNVNGFGDYRREFGSVGLQIDVRGNDFYGPRGANESIWESGRYGLGIDLPGEASKPRGDIVVNDYPFKERAFTTKELYTLAMRSEPRFQHWKDYAFNKMVEDSVASVEFLRGVLDTKDATKRHAIKDILVKIGMPAVPMLCDETVKGNDLAKAEASWILGLIESPAGFDALMQLSHSKDWRQRSGAINSLARLNGLDAVYTADLKKRLTEVLGDASEMFYVRKDACFAVGNQMIYDLVPPVVGCLDDPHYSVRYAAAEALRQLVRGTASPQVSAQPAPGDIVAGAIKDELPSLSPLGLVPALYAATDLPASQRMDIAEAALGLPGASELYDSVAVARLLKSITPEGASETKRLESLKARLPQDSWEVRSVLSR